MHYDKIRRYIIEKKGDGIPLSINEKNTISMKCHKLSNFIYWGKYKGQYISDIVFQDPEYILWCILSLDNFSIEPVCFLTKEFRQHEWFKIAVETNLVKLKLIADWVNEPNSLNDNEIEVQPIDSDKKKHWTNDELESADWKYDYSNPAHNPSENPWIDAFGPGDEAESAYWNTD